MRFHWPLQRLLDVTEKRELAIKAELFELSRQIAELEEKVQRRRGVVAEALEVMRRQDARSRINCHEMFMHSLASEQRRILMLQGQIADLHAERSQVLAAYAKIRGKKDNLGRLRSDARRDFDRLVDLREQQQMDETFQISFARRRQAEAQGLLKLA